MTIITRKRTEIDVTVLLTVICTKGRLATSSYLNITLSNKITQLPVTTLYEDSRSAVNNRLDSSRMLKTINSQTADDLVLLWQRTVRMLVLNYNYVQRETCQIKNSNN